MTGYREYESSYRTCPICKRKFQVQDAHPHQIYCPKIRGTNCAQRANRINRNRKLVKE